MLNKINEVPVYNLGAINSGEDIDSFNFPIDSTIQIFVMKKNKNSKKTYSITNQGEINECYSMRITNYKPYNSGFTNNIRQRNITSDYNSISRYPTKHLNLFTNNKVHENLSDCLTIQKSNVIRKNNITKLQAKNFFDTNKSYGNERYIKNRHYIKRLMWSNGRVKRSREEIFHDLRNQCTKTRNVNMITKQNSEIGRYKKQYYYALKTSCDFPHFDMNTVRKKVASYAPMKRNNLSMLSHIIL